MHTHTLKYNTRHNLTFYNYIPILQLIQFYLANLIWTFTAIYNLYNFTFNLNFLYNRRIPLTMFGHTTPVKNRARAGPSRTSEEHDRDTTTDPTGPARTAEPERPNILINVRRLSGEIEARTSSSRPKEKTPPKPLSQKTRSRTAEARACLTKTKISLNKVMNLKVEIKVTVLEGLDRLYALVKEAKEATPLGEKPPPADQSPLKQTDLLAAQIKKQNEIINKTLKS